MLDNPVTDNAVNIEAAEMLATSPYTYNKIVRECVEYSRLINSKNVYYVEFCTDERQTLK